MLRGTYQNTDDDEKLILIFELDMIAGSATTAIAADNIGRDFIGCEKSEKEYQQALSRIN